MMRKISYILSLILIFLIPWEGAVKVDSVGTLTRLVGFVVATAWFIAVLVSGRLRKPGLFHISFLLFIAWHAVSTFWSPFPKETFAHLDTWVQLFILTWILWDLYTTRASVLSGLQAYVLGAYMAVGVAWGNYLAGNAFYDNYNRFSSGDSNNPDGFGTILAMGIPMALYLASARDARRNNFLQWVNLLYIPVAFVGISLSGTRTALIAAIPALAFGMLALSQYKIWARIGVLIIIALVIYSLLPTVLTFRSVERFNTIVPEVTEGTLNDRTLLWQDGVTAFVNNPLLGVGSHMYRTINRFGKVAHNSFVSTLIEVGLIGLVLFIGTLAIALRQAWQHPRLEKWFWVTLFVVWVTCSTTLTWEDKKVTWLFLSMIVASLAAMRAQAESAAAEPLDATAGQLAWQGKS